MALARLARGAGSIRAQELDDALWQIREALVAGSVPGIRERCAELRNLLAEGELADDRSPRRHDHSLSTAR